MDLTGFEHVFKDAVVVDFAEDFSVKAIPLTVLMLLKIVAYLENPYRRAKDGLPYSWSRMPHATGASVTRLLRLASLLHTRVLFCLDLT